MTFCPTCKRPFKKSRSNSQNRFYWGCVVEMIAEHTGYSTDETHEILRFAFLIRFKQMGNKELSYIASTSDLDTKAFEEYITKIREWAWNTLQISIPMPNEYEEV